MVNPRRPLNKCLLPYNGLYSDGWSVHFMPQRFQYTSSLPDCSVIRYVHFKKLSDESFFLLLLLLFTSFPVSPRHLPIWKKKKGLRLKSLYIFFVEECMESLIGEILPVYRSWNSLRGLFNCSFRANPRTPRF